MDIFNEKEELKTSLSEELFDFISFLSLNENLYNNILNNYNSNENMKLSKKSNEVINNLYTLLIIESIIEDVAIIYNNKKEKIYPLISEENTNNKNNSS